MSALICGSMAYDTIMVFNDKFSNHILPDQVHILNVSFQVPTLRKEFGGCAGNIAYNLKLLGEEPLPMATVGQDFTPYESWLKKFQIDQRYIKVIPNSYTAQAYITTDLDDNQITAFHPGAMNYSQESKISEAKGYRIGMVSPDGREGMLAHAKQFSETGASFIFDPGQGLILFDGEELRLFIKQASWVVVNDYEAQLLQQRTGLSPHEIAAQVSGYIVTRGAEGSLIYTPDKRLEIPPVRAQSVLDPTGCGDAYRAGLLYGLLNEMDWETIGRIASLMGAIKVAHPGTQNHHFTLEEFDDKFHTEFGWHI